MIWTYERNWDQKSHCGREEARDISAELVNQTDVDVEAIATKHEAAESPESAES